MPLNPDGKGMLAPTTMFNSVISFLTNTNLQHYSGEQHLSYFSQLFFVCWNMFVSASVGFCGLAAIIRGLRSDPHMGNYYLDMWRVCAYTFVPASLIMGVLLLADGVPMTLDGARAGRHGRAGGDGNGRQRQAATPTADCPRPGRRHHSHQAPGHQRRRVLRGQFDAPLRESQRWSNIYGHELLPVSLSPWC